jgi:hypothetical protein
MENHCLQRGAFQSFPVVSEEGQCIIRPLAAFHAGDEQKRGIWMFVIHTEL